PQVPSWKDGRQSGNDTHRCSLGLFKKGEQKSWNVVTKPLAIDVGQIRIALQLGERDGGPIVSYLAASDGRELCVRKLPSIIVRAVVVADFALPDADTVFERDALKSFLHQVSKFIGVHGR